MADAKPPRSGLGRGLSALMADISLPEALQQDGISKIHALPVEQIAPNLSQPRTDFSLELLTELAESIKKKGVVQPLIVRPTTTPGKYEIVAGERRWRAAQIAGLGEVPVVVRAYGDEEVLEIAIVENIQRTDLNPVEEAQAYRQLMDRFGHTQEKLSENLGRSRSHIANTLRLLQLPQSVLTLLRSGKLSAGHARALVTSPKAEKLANEVVARGLSVRQTEALVRSLDPADSEATRNKRNSSKEKDPDTRAIEADLSANLGMLVSISHRGPDEGGTLEISYRTLDQLDLLCDVLSKIRRDLLSN